MSCLASLHAFLHMLWMTTMKIYDQRNHSRISAVIFLINKEGRSNDWGYIRHLAERSSSTCVQLKPCFLFHDLMTVEILFFYILPSVTPSLQLLNGRAEPHSNSCGLLINEMPLVQMLWHSRLNLV